MYENLIGEQCMCFHILTIVDLYGVLGLKFTILVITNN